jgi:hypothetical protein
MVRGTSAYLEVRRVEDDLMAALADPQRYASPTRECDIVMKGGITSGVIYPLAVCELVGVYRLRNIGGTSAGAIAATAAAATEHGRHSEQGGFPKLTHLPKWLGESMKARWPDPLHQLAGVQDLRDRQPAAGGPDRRHRQTLVGRPQRKQRITGELHDIAAVVDHELDQLTETTV